MANNEVLDKEMGADAGCSKGVSLTNDMAELFEDFMEYGNLGLHIVNNQGTIVWANQAELDLLGYKRDEYVGHSIRDFHASEEKIDYILSVLTSGGKLSNYTAPIRCKDGRIEYMDITSSMRKVDGEYTTTRCFSVCVTNKASVTADDLVSSEEKTIAAGDNGAGEKTNESSHGGHTESEKEELAVLFEDFMEFGSVGLHIVDSTGIIRWANKAEMDLLGYTREEYFGKSVTEVYADHEVLQQLLTTLLSGKKLVRAVTPLWAKDGHVEYVEINSSMRKVNGKYSTTRCFSTVVTDRVLLEREEAKAREKEKEAAASREETRRKTDFLRKLCHELRNPLAGVTGNLELLLSELQQAQHEGLLSPKRPPISSDLTTEERLAETEKRLAEAELKLLSMQHLVGAAIDYAESAQLAAEHQMLVVNDTLSLSRLETEGSEFSIKPVDVIGVLDSVQAILGVKAKEKSINFTVAKEGLPERGRYVQTDPVWLKQILINLVSNALKFTDADQGRVDLVVGLQEARDKDPEDNVTLLFTVTDNGIGMTKEEQGRLFGVFAQANDRISSQFGGSGLGLYIVKQLLEHIGGTVSVVSEKGKGSSFIVKMPCKALPPEDRLRLETSRAKSLLEKPSSQELRPASQNGNIRVLVVDDSSVNRKMLASFLKKRGYTHDVAENGAVAYEMHDRTQFDVILTDVDMPVMDGNELTRKLRRKESESSYDTSTPKAPVTIIGISGNALPDDIASAKKDGMDAYISKPFNFKQLESLILKHGDK